ncbi:Cation channel sperm-associated protein 4 like protein [Aduncisulcus paluster]|uniref:Cation channel sperm-associated protein 4 like protein n=1 Tax=Aduncisulcus paluster TaxID=2918883 RepID=A0ABQ5KIA0_9EUKA|nr:Cation channel sperm-associated protein 4 like protein [Aduncisulcus paluster]
MDAGQLLKNGNRKFAFLQSREDKSTDIVPNTQFHVLGPVIHDSHHVVLPQKSRNIFIDYSKPGDEIYQGSVLGNKLNPQSKLGSTQKSVIKRVDDIANEDVAFSDVVDEDHHSAFENYLSDELVGKLTESGFFKTFILIIIIINAIMTGVQTDDSVNRSIGSILDLLDVIFLVIFTVEILLKWYHSFIDFWKSGWNWFDFVIVFVSILGSSISFISSARVLRVLRVLRAFRSLRSITILQGLQIIVETVFKSVPSMVNVLLMIVLVMFIFSIVGVTVLAADIPEYFASLSDAFYSCFTLLTQDGWVDIYRRTEETGHKTFGGIYCFSFIVLGAFVLANIIVGVTTNLLLKAHKEIKIAKKMKSRRLHRQQKRTGMVTKTQGLQLGNGMISTTHKDTISSRIVDAKVYERQRPICVPQIKPSAQSLETYLLILGAVQDNLNEFCQLHQELQAIFAEIAEINVDLEHANVDGTLGISDGESSKHEEEEETSDTADVVTAMIRREKKMKEKQSRAIQRYNAANRIRIKRVMDSAKSWSDKKERMKYWLEGKLLAKFSLQPGATAGSTILPSPRSAKDVIVTTREDKRSRKERLKREKEEEKRIIMEKKRQDKEDKRRKEFESGRGIEMGEIRTTGSR